MTKDTHPSPAIDQNLMAALRRGDPASALSERAIAELEMAITQKAALLLPSSHHLTLFPLNIPMPAAAYGLNIRRLSWLGSGVLCLVLGLGLGLFMSSSTDTGTGTTTLSLLSDPWIITTR